MTTVPPFQSPVILLAFKKTRHIRGLSCWVRTLLWCLRRHTYHVELWFGYGCGELEGMAFSARQNGHDGRSGTFLERRGFSDGNYYFYNIPIHAAEFELLSRWVLDHQADLFDADAAFYSGTCCWRRTRRDDAYYCASAVFEALRTAGIVARLAVTDPAFGRVDHNTVTAQLLEDKLCSPLAQQCGLVERSVGFKEERKELARRVLPSSVGTVEVYWV